MVELVAACELKDDLDLLSWLIDNLPKGDPIVYEFLKREVNYYAGKNMLDY